MQAVPPRRPILGLLVLALVLPACGGDEDGFDRDSFESVYGAAMQAVADRDLKALWPHLTEPARGKVERDLREWQESLRDPERGRFLLERIEERRGVVPVEELDRAKNGTIEDVWQFFLRADPRPARPKRASLQVAQDGKSVTIDYVDPQGTLRKVRLAHAPAGWFITELQL